MRTSVKRSGEPIGGPGKKYNVNKVECLELKDQRDEEEGSEAIPANSKKARNLLNHYMNKINNGVELDGNIALRGMKKETKYKLQIEN